MRCGDCKWFDSDADHYAVDAPLSSTGLCMWWTAFRTLNAAFGAVDSQPRRHGAFADANPKWCNAWEPREVDE